MLSFFGKKKISTETVSKQFVAHLLEATEKGFPELAELINIDQAFEQSPNVSHDNSSRSEDRRVGKEGCGHVYFWWGAAA